MQGQQNLFAGLVQSANGLQAQLFGLFVSGQGLVDGQAGLVVVIDHHTIGFVTGNQDHGDTGNDGDTRYREQKPGPELFVPGGGGIYSVFMFNDVGVHVFNYSNEDRVASNKSNPSSLDPRPSLLKQGTDKTPLFDDVQVFIVHGLQFEVYIIAYFSQLNRIDLDTCGNGDGAPGLDV